MMSIAVQVRENRRCVPRSWLLHTVRIFFPAVCHIGESKKNNKNKTRLGDKARMWYSFESDCHLFINIAFT
jgi:hypothetical protein